MRSLDDLIDEGVRGRNVLIRCDLNVPLDGTVITDDSRIRASVGSIQRLANAGAKVVVLAHLGRPEGKRDPQYSLAPAAARLSELLGAPVALAHDVSGDSARAVVSALSDGDIAMLENVRFDPRETSKVDAERASLAAEWAELGDAYVSDGFGVVHRAQASVSDVAHVLPAYAGDLVLAEASVFSKVLSDPDRPYVVVLGGSKVSDKLGVIENLLPRVDRLLIGGGMCFTFLAAQGFSVGKSLLESDQVDTVRGFLDDAAARGVEIVLPVDVVVSDQISDDAHTSVVGVADIPDDLMGLDLGPESIELFTAKLADARTVVWNGPMGVFEKSPFAQGTRQVALAISAIDGMSVVGGGDSAAAVHLLGIPTEGFSHISTGGGASLEFLEGRVLPGIAALEGV